MKAKDYVLSIMPKAKAENHTQRGPFGKVYWLIRDGSNMFPLADGTSESNAWVNAKNILIELEQSNTNP